VSRVQIGCLYNVSADSDTWQYTLPDLVTFATVVSQRSALPVDVTLPLDNIQKCF